MVTERDIWRLLEEVADPELPVVNLVEMGIVRDVALDGDGHATITITPTFTGCPALHTMQEDIIERLKQADIDARVEVTLIPAWTTDWITDEAREKLRGFGLTPPGHHDGDFELLLVETITCPYCGSKNTLLKNNWGPTPCRAIYYCNQCRQGFELFKPL